MLSTEVELLRWVLGHSHEFPSVGTPCQQAGDTGSQAGWGEEERPRMAVQPSWGG